MLRLLILLITLLPSLYTLAQSASEPAFEIVKQEYNATLYERWITFPESNPPVTAREVKGEFTINRSVQDILAIIKDESRIKLWQKRILEFKVYPISDSSWRAYSYHYIPWPLNNQDHYLHYEMREGSGGKKVIAFKTVTDEKVAPKRNGVTRMVLAGGWVLDPVGENKTKVTYRILSMPMGYPRFIVDPIIRGNLMSTIQSLIEVAEKK